MMFSISLYANALLAAATTVAAHGYVDNATIGGTFYQFYQPYGDQYMNPAPQRVSRKIPSNGPVLDVSTIDVQCGGWSPEGKVGSAPAPLHAPAAAGSQVTLRWTAWPDSHRGPMITWMALCPSEGCQNWLPGTSPVWFKIKQEGRQGTSDVWATTPFMTVPNAGYTYTIPSCLKPGSYLVRHEIIALHSAWAVGEAQFYPSCHQLKVTGNGTKVPITELVAFPGAYDKNDPGIFYNQWNPTTYTIPAPQIPPFTC
ncbi:glycoside hydrolase [Halenospora varia]|nr:glycoside hydrolase [Halenospora varia]